MYLVIIILPLLGSIAAGFFGRKIGVNGAQFITCSAVIITTMLAVIAFFEVGLNNIPVSIQVFRWIDSESLNVSWGFHFDSLTVSMLIPVLIVSSLVHIYSIGYMSHDPREDVLGKRSYIYGDKLSNSGELLKLKVPNYIWKCISGWTNYSGKVTSLKMSENKMDNRGSKSDFRSNLNYVKEQRVDGSWCIKSRLMHLRYTLKGFERNCSLKIPSKQLIVKRFSSTLISSVKPWFLSGIIDAEGSFTIIIDKNQIRKLGWRVQSKFQIGLHIRDLNILNQLQKHLEGIGTIHIDQTRNRVNYSIDSAKELNKLFVHLERFPLLTQKAADFILFKQAVNLMNNKAHLTIEGLNQIVNIKASMNLGLSDKLKAEFKGYSPVEKPVVNNEKTPDPSWIAGFVSGEGNFYVHIAKGTTKIGYRVQLRFRITQHIRDIKLMESIMLLLGSGSIYKYPKQSAINITIMNSSDISNKIIPFFNEYPIMGVKLYDYLYWCKIHNLILDGSHLTPEGINIIRNIKAGMNKGRDFTLNN